MKLRDAFVARTDEPDGEPIEIRAGRCEARVRRGSRGVYGIPTGYCGKPGRWLTRHEIRCGEHKAEE